MEADVAIYVVVIVLVLIVAAAVAVFLSRKRRSEHHLNTRADSPARSAQNVQK